MSNMEEMLHKIDRIIVKVVKSISYVSGVCLVGIMFVAFFNVIGEKLRIAGLPVTGIPASTEIIQYLHIPVVFMASAYVSFDRGHTRIDLLSSKMPQAMQSLFETLGYVCGAAICAFVSQRGFVQMLKFIKRHKMSSVSGFGFPLWPFALILGLGFALLSFSFLWNIVRQYLIKTEPVGGEN